MDDRTGLSSSAARRGGTLIVSAVPVASVGLCRGPRESLPLFLPGASTTLHWFMSAITPADRLPVWIRASWKLAGHAKDTHLVFDLQDVGYLEFTIRQLEAKFNDLNTRGQQDGITLTQARSLSRMWVLALYEALRTYRVACRKGCANDAWSPFKDLFDDLNNIREPLAKHQVAGRRDRHLTEPTYDPTTGIGWSYFNPRKETYEQSSRLEISDRFLGIVSTLAGAGEIEAARAAAAEDSDLS
jgi:hypothetical protein